MYLLIGLWQSLVLCVVFSFSFVLSLYVWRRSLHDDRDDPTVIKQRLFSVTSICILAPIVIIQFAHHNTPTQVGPAFLTWIGLNPRGMLPALVYPLLLTAALFTGPMLAYLLSHSSRLPHHLSEHYTTLMHNDRLYLIALRNYIGAPLGEEFIFRACICTLLISAGWSFVHTLLLSPLLFGIAHLHHLIGLVHHKGYTLKQGLLTVCFQLCHTTAFGCYAAYLYLRTGQLLACFVSHAFCNLMEVPDLSFLHTYHPLYARRHAVLAAYVVGIVLFVVLLVPLTEPALYHSFMDQLMQQQYLQQHGSPSAITLLADITVTTHTAHTDISSTTTHYIPDLTS